MSASTVNNPLSNGEGYVETKLEVNEPKEEEGDDMLGFQNGIGKKASSKKVGFRDRAPSSIEDRSDISEHEMTHSFRSQNPGLKGTRGFDAQFKAREAPRPSSRVDRRTRVDTWIKKSGMSRFKYMASLLIIVLFWPVWLKLITLQYHVSVYENIYISTYRQTKHFSFSDLMTSLFFHLLVHVGAGKKIFFTQ